MSDLFPAREDVTALLLARRTYKAARAKKPTPQSIPELNVAACAYVELLEVHEDKLLNMAAIFNPLIEHLAQMGDRGTLALMAAVEEMEGFLEDTCSP